MSNDSSKAEPSTIAGRRGRWRVRTDRIRPIGFGAPWLVVVNTLAIFLISQFIAALIIGLGLGVIHRSTDLAKELDNSAPAQFFFVLLAESLAVGLVYWILKRRGLSLKAIGWGRKPHWRDLKKGLLGFGVFYISLIIITAALTLLVPSFDINQEQDVGFKNLPTLLDGSLAFIALVILPPFGEETLVRGYLYSGLRKSWRFVPAMLFTSLLFGLAHLQPGQQGNLVWAAAVDTFVLSLVLVYLRESTGALYAGILVHALNNMVAFGVHFYGVIF